LRRCIVFLVLVLAACGGDQPAESTASASSDEQVAEREVVDVPTEDGAVAASPSTTAVPADEPVDEETSPLSSAVVELPSALPERVLEGLGEPIGSDPLSISIPSLGVDAAMVVPVGLEPNGEMEVPEADTVGWYRFGVGVDGGRGSAVLAGHIAYNGRDGVFRDLIDLQPGDRVEVEQDEGTIAYEVVSVTDFDKYELPIDDLFSESGDERLVLITCGGSFNASLRSYDDNTVVIARPLPQA